MLKRVFLGLTALVAATAAGASLVYLRDMRRAYRRVQGASQVISSPYGDIEYVEGGGDGPVVLVVHGSGGGFDQGALLARAVLGERFRWIAPSRFGYLRSTFHEGATFEDQAHAYAYLLDRLHINRAAVIALSHGGPSALLFAALHPDRVASLTLVSAGVASSGDADQAQANRKGDALTAIFQRDIAYWAVTKSLRGKLYELMGATTAVAAGFTPEQQRLAGQLIDFMNPASLRAAGVRFDNTAALPNERIASIRAPTLILHAKDDALQLYRNAEFAAAVIPGARLVSFENGGHLMLIVEQPTVRKLIEEHLLRSD